MDPRKLTLAPASQVIIFFSQEHNGPIVPLVSGVGVQERGEVGRIERKAGVAFEVLPGWAGDLGREKPVLRALCLLTRGDTSNLANPRRGLQEPQWARSCPRGGCRPKHAGVSPDGHASLAEASNSRLSSCR